MAEALGVVASVVGIASAGIALATRLHDLVDQFGSTFDDIEVIATDLNGFSIVLDELSKKLNVHDSEKAASNQLIRGIEDVMSTCDVLFKDIRDMIATAEDSNTKMARFTTKVKWVFRKNKVKGVKATLECQKATLSLMLQILRDDDNSLQRAILKNLLREHDRTLGVLESIQKENAALKVKESKRDQTTNKTEESTVYLPGDVTTDSDQDSSAQSAMILLSKAVPRLLLDGPHGNSGNQVDQKSSIGPYVTGVTSPRTAIPPTVEKKSDVDLLISKWICRPSLQAQESTSFQSKVPSNLPDYGVHSSQEQAKMPTSNYPTFASDQKKRTTPMSRSQAKRPAFRNQKTCNSPDLDEVSQKFGERPSNKNNHQPVIDRKWEELEELEEAEDTSDGDVERVQCAQQ